MANQFICPICGESGLCERKESVLRKHGGCERGLPFHYSHCTLCESVTLSEAQANHNKAQMTNFYSEANQYQK